jgi:nicotinate-nucleotide adenylyltransferase
VTNTRLTGILGGTFDPVHVAHVELAKLVIRELALTDLVVIPSGHPWQKEAVGASGAQRMAMLELAFSKLDCPVTFDDRELRRSGPSYSFDTLTELRSESGADQALVFIIGADQLQGLQTWYRWREIFDVCHLAAAGRPGFGTTQGELDAQVAKEVALRRVPAKSFAARQIASHGALCIIDADLGDISSSDVRARLARHDLNTVKALVPVPVLDYIRHNHLYKI